MKTLFTIALVLICALSFSQARLGYSELDVRAEYWESQYQLNKSKTDNGIYYLSLVTDYALVIHYLNNRNIVYESLIVPNNKGSVHFFIELYNKQYVILSNTSWRVYGDDAATFIVKLIYDKAFGYIFTWEQE